MSMSDVHPTLDGPPISALAVTSPTRATASPTRRSVLSRELRTHTDFAACLLLLWLTVPMIATAAGMLSPALLQVSSLDAGATAVTISGLISLYRLLFLGVAGVVVVSFVARLVLVPGRATGDFHKDVSGRFSVRVGLGVALVNFLGLTFYTAAIAEAWIFPLLTFSTCQVMGIFVERLRHSPDALW